MNEQTGCGSLGKAGSCAQKSHKQACLRLKNLILRVYKEPPDPLLGQANKTDKL